MTAEQVERFLQVDFKRLVEGAGIRGARVHVERAATADYEKVLELYSETEAANQARTRLASIEQYLSKTKKEGAQNGRGNSEPSSPAIEH